MADAANTHYEDGLTARKEVLGEAHVLRSIENTSSFSAPLQSLVTEYCWGNIWTRDGIDRKTRSLVNLGMLTALGRMHEFRLHVQGAINNGCTPEEIREVLLQAAVYCGMPAGLESFRAAEEVLTALEVLD